VFLWVKPNPSQDLPTHHAANSKRLFSVDPYAASRSVQSVCFHRCYLVNLAVVQPDFLSVGYRIGNRFDEVVQIWFFAMPDWWFSFRDSVLVQMRFGSRKEEV